MSVPMDAMPGPGELLSAFCLRCGYSLRGLPASGEGVCPECGEPAERMPTGDVFVCGSGRRRDGLWWPRALAVGFGLGGLVFFALVAWLVIVVGFAGSRAYVVTPAIIAPVMALLAVLFWPWPRSDARVVVDCARGRLRFEWCDLERPLGLTASTGKGMEVAFGEVLGVERRMQGERTTLIRIAVPRGRVIVDSGFSNFLALLAVVGRVAPSTVPYWRSRRADKVLAIGVMLLVAGVMVLGALLGW